MLPSLLDAEVPSAESAEVPTEAEGGSAKAESAEVSVTTTIAPQQHHSAPILLPYNLQAATMAIAVALESVEAPVTLQDASLRGAVDLFQAALLLRSTRHPALQQPALVANRPTGSALLNLLLVQVSLEVGEKVTRSGSAASKKHFLPLRCVATWRIA